MQRKQFIQQLWVVTKSNKKTTQTSHLCLTSYPFFGYGHHYFTLCGAVSTLQSAERSTAMPSGEKNSSVSEAVAPKRITAHFSCCRVIPSQMQDLCKRKQPACCLAQMNRWSVHKWVWREWGRTWLCFMALWSPTICPGTNLVHHCHLLGLRFTQ